MPSLRVAFWLVPAAPQHALFSGIIAELAQAFGAPCFEPHVTLSSTSIIEVEEARRVARKVAATTATFELTAGPTGTTADFFQTLFVEIVPAPPLPRLCEFLRQELSGKTTTPRQPHLSLLYRELPEATRTSLPERFAFEGTRIAFDRLAAVTPGPGQDDWRAVERWETLERTHLRRRSGQGPRDRQTES